MKAQVLRTSWRVRATVAVTTAGLVLAFFTALFAGSGNAATKKSVVIGVMAATNNNVQSVPEVLSTAKAAAGWVNSHGGIKGGKLVVRTCETHQTADSAVVCANKLIQQKVVAVVPSGDIGMQAAQKVFESAKIPTIGGMWYFPPEMRFKYRSTMVGAGADLEPGNAYYAVKAFKAKSIVIVSQEGSAANTEPFLNTPLRKLGAGFKGQFIGAPVTAASDLLPYFQAAASKKPDVVSVFGMPCVPALQAFKASGSKAKLLQPAQCADASTLSKVSSLANNTYYQFQSRDLAVDPNNADIKVFKAALKRYAPSEKHANSDFGAAGFSGVMNLADLAKELPIGKVTPAALHKLVRQNKNRHNWLGLSGTYNCGRAPKAYPGICSSEVQLTKYNNGKFTRVKVNGKDYANVIGLI